MKSKLGYNPDYVVPPGETVRETMKVRGISQRQLAERLGCSTVKLRRYLRGEIPLPAGWSVVFNELFAVSVTLWLALDRNYWDGIEKGAKKL